MRSAMAMNTMSLRPRNRSSLNKIQVIIMKRLPANEKHADPATIRYTIGTDRGIIGVAPATIIRHTNSDVKAR